MEDDAALFVLARGRILIGPTQASGFPMVLTLILQKVRKRNSAALRLVGTVFASSRVKEFCGLYRAVPFYTRFCVYLESVNETKRDGKRMAC